MKVINVEQKPENYGYCDIAALSDYEIERAEESGADLLIYWYASGSYEGSGEALLRKDGLWIYENLGHCSCYGPFDTTPSFDGAQTLDALEARMTDELKGQCAELFKRARRFK